MTDRELMQQALEALWTCSEGDYSTGYPIHPSFDEVAVDKTITALQERLNQYKALNELVELDQEIGLFEQEEKEFFKKAKEAAQKADALQAKQDEPDAVIIGNELYFPFEIDWAGLLDQGYKVEMLYLKKTSNK